MNKKDKYHKRTLKEIDKDGRVKCTHIVYDLDAMIHGNKPEADAYLRKWLNKLEAAEAAKDQFQPTDKILSEWLIEWVEGNFKRDSEKNTYELNRWIIDKHIIPMLGHAPLGK